MDGRDEDDGSEELLRGLGGLGVAVRREGSRSSRGERERERERESENTEGGENPTAKDFRAGGKKLLFIFPL